MAGDGEGGSIGAIETRPAMRETRCWEDRLRGRERVGERNGNVQFTSGVCDGKGTSGCKVWSGEYGCMRKGEPEIGDSVNCEDGWMSGSRTRGCDLGGGVVSTEIGADRPGGFINVRFGRSGTDNRFVLPEGLTLDGLGGWLSLEFQSKPRPMEVTPQLLPTLVAPQSMGAGLRGSQSSSSKVKSRADSASIKRN